MTDVMPITIDGEALASLRTDIDTMMARTLKTMAMTQNGEATVSVKIKITLNKEVIPTEDGVRNAVRPVFEHDVQSVVQTKDKTSGSMNGEYELVYDEETDEWVMKSTRRQISMFDANEQPVEAEVVDAEPRRIAAVRALPAGDPDDCEEDDEPSYDQPDADPDDDYIPDDDPDYEPDYGPEE